MKIHHGDPTKHIWASLVILFMGIVFFFPAWGLNQTFFAFDCLFEYLPWKTAETLVRSHNPLITDPINGYYPPFFYPSHWFFQEYFKFNDVPFWFHLNFSGVPFFPYGNPLPFILYALFPLTIAHDLLLFISITGCGIFTFLYLRDIRLSFWPSLLGAIAWMFNGYVMVWFEFENVPMMALGLSAGVFAIERWFSRRHLKSMIGMIVAFGFCLSTAYAHLLILQFMFFAAYLVFRFVKNQYSFDEPPAGNKMMVMTVLACVLSGIIGMHFLTSHLYLFQSNQRQGMDVQDLFDNTGKLLPKYLVTAAFPDFYGSPTRQLCFTPRSSVNQAYNNYNELCIYSGMITLFLAFSSLLFIRKSAYIAFYVLASLLCLTFSMGSPLFAPLAWWIPGLNLSTPTRILYLYGFSFCMLAAFGFEYVLNHKQKGLIFIWVFILIVCMFLVFYLQTHNGLRWATGVHNLNMLSRSVYSLVSEHFHWKSVVIGMPMIFALASFFLLVLLYNTTNASIKTVLCALSVAILSFDLMGFGQLYNTTTPRALEFPETPAISFLKKDHSTYRIMTLGPFLHHAFVPFGIQDISGYGSMYPGQYGKYLFLSQHRDTKAIPTNFSRWIQCQHANSPLLDLLNVKYVLTPKDMVMNTPQHKKVFDGNITIYENMSVIPRAFCVSSFEIPTSETEMLDALRQWDVSDFKHTVLLDEQPDLSGPLHPSDNTFTQAAVAIQTYQPNTIKLQVNAPRNCLLVLSDTYHPGWQAFVDGVPEKVYRANYIMRAVYIPEGTHTVTFQFKPLMLRSGWFITIFGWVFAGIMLAIGFFRFDVPPRL
ncbi:MAG: YfhO family protein [Candidatus Magnetomorum sp.]|nr:YfhO family protein [Candidatus Magnetomorum sp.]